MHIAISVLILVLFTTLPAAFACGADSDCRLQGDRIYRIMLPEGYDGKTKIGAIIFAHSLGSTAEGTLRNKRLVKVASELGVALVAAKAAGNDWNIPNSPSNRSIRSTNEFSYFDDLIADISKRFAIDRSKLVMAGTSVGGTMTWKMACERSDRFAGFVPLAGTFWRKPPVSCPSTPANVIHVHGKADRVMPLQGRRVGDSNHSNIFEVIESYAQIGGFEPTGKSAPLDLECHHALNAQGKVLDFCLHDGGHAFRANHLLHAWRRLEAVGAL